MNGWILKIPKRGVSLIQSCYQNLTPVMQPKLASLYNNSGSCLCHFVSFSLYASLFKHLLFLSPVSAEWIWISCAAAAINSKCMR